MVSKGVDYYSFVATSNTNIKFSGPKVGSTTTSANNADKNHLEIESSNLPPFVYTGTFEWTISRDNHAVFRRREDISSFTGNLQGGDLDPMMSTPAVCASDATISFGLYDAGSGIANLPSSDQAWVSIVPNLEYWMSDIASVGSPQEKQPFSTFVLAAAHDAGMNTMAGINLITSGPRLAILIAALTLLIPVPGLGALLAASAPKIMLGLAMTQKESTTAMLLMGVRYFDFRPAYLLPGVRSIVSAEDDTLYHTHLVIPGQRFDSFLKEVVFFLQKHQNEFVVIRTCSDGIQKCEIPSLATITQFVNAALSGTGIQLGGSSCFQQSIEQLRASNTRLILVHENAKYDSYDDTAYATLSPNTILKKFGEMKTEHQANNDFTILQCQGTSTNLTDVLIYAATAANWSTSPLMATKASFDIKTLPWLLNNAVNNLQAKQNLIIMNDFIDGATTWTSFLLNQKRFGYVPQLFSEPVTGPAIPASVPSEELEGGITSIGVAEGMKAREEAALVDQRANEALLQSIADSHRTSLDAKETVSEEDRKTQAVLEAVRREAEEVRKRQEELVALAEKRVQAARPGGQ